MFLFNLAYVKPLDEIEGLLPAHIQFLDEFYARPEGAPHRRRDSLPLREPPGGGKNPGPGPLFSGGGGGI